MTMDRFINQVYCENARRLLAEIPTHSVDAGITDAMFGTKAVRYDTMRDPGGGNPFKHWAYHEPVIQEYRRVIKPGGILAVCQGFRFIPYFKGWFGDHEIWRLMWTAHGLYCKPSFWVVQTRERQPIPEPKDWLRYINRDAFKALKQWHPCPKPLEEMLWMVEHLTRPGDIILDPFCGIGATLVAAQLLGRRWIGCDVSRKYCQMAMWRLANLKREAAGIRAIA